MTDFQLPALVTNLFAAFGINDPAQMLILLLSSILGVLLILIVLIAFHGRPSESGASPTQRKAETNSTADRLAEEPVISVARQPPNEDASVTRKEDNKDEAVDAAEQIEDFQIFKRSAPKSTFAGQSLPVLATDDGMSIAEHLRLIEKEMVRLRELYRDGHITRDIYIDETRSLYHQARGLSSVS